MNDPLDVYQNIGNLLSEFAPKSWRRLIMIADLYDDSVGVSIECWMGDGEDSAQYIEGSPPRLGLAITRLAPMLSTEEKGYFKSMLFNMTSDGKFKVDYDYNNFRLSPS